MFGKVAIAGLAALLCLFTAMPVSFAASEPPVLRGRAALLLDGLSGQILYQQNAYDQNYPASTTKLLTALVAVEHSDLDRLITVSATAVDQDWDSSSCYISQGDELTLRNLLYGLLLASGNDCAVAIAEGVSDDHPEQFVAWMNERAKEFGATKSHFANPSGLHDPNHYTTALDLALIARGALADPRVLEIAGTQEFDWPGKESNGTYYNHNRLLFEYEQTIGGKTGFTEEAGNTLVNAVTRNGQSLIGVLMGEPSAGVQYEDMIALLDYGFEQFEKRAVIGSEAFATSIPIADGVEQSVQVSAKGSFPVSALKGDQPEVTVAPKLDQGLTAPVEVGTQVGVLEIRQGDRLLGVLPVVTGHGVAASSAPVRHLGSWGILALKWAAYGAGGLLLLRLVVKGTRRALRRRRMAPASYRRGRVSP